jgi:hypothetical protein
VPVLNSENLDSKPDLEIEQVSVNVKAIAQVCGSSPDQVTYFLTKLRDLAFSYPKEKKKVVSLNLSFGHLILNCNQTIEFRSQDLNHSQVSQS